jgi:hypothetical protein
MSSLEEYSVFLLSQAAALAQFAAPQSGLLRFDAAVGFNDEGPILTRCVE